MNKKIIHRSDFLEHIPASERSQPEALVFALMQARNEQLDENSYALSNLHKPELMKGIGEAVAILIEALVSQKRILIVGDFDADGATSTAVLYRSLIAFGAQYLNYLVPNRFEYGYGLTPEIVALGQQYAPEIIITVDNGISSIEGVAAAKALGICVIVTDHHLPGRELPDADAIVNPNQPGCEFPSKSLAGVGVIFYVMLALRAGLRQSQWFTQKEIPEPNLAQFLDLVALGTVADVVPLDRNNRILVAQGLQRIRAKSCCVGILAILKIANRDFEKISANDFGFAIGPRLNAAGRLDDMSVGIRCLLSNDWREALDIATELDSLNKERRAIEASMQVDAERDLGELLERDLADKNGLCLYREDWHQGVVGILASRIKDRQHRPTIAFAAAGEGELKGSGRSIAGIHLRDVLDELASSNPGLLKKFGGHAMAAGVSIEQSRFAEFEAAFDLVVGRLLSDEMKEPIVVSDGCLSAEQCSLAHAQAIKDAGPWGQAFPEPIFNGVFRLIDQKIVGAKHLKLLLGFGEFSDLVFDAIAFNVDLDFWPNTAAREVSIAFKLDVNEFRGRQSVQLMVEYIEAL